MRRWSLLSAITFSLALLTAFPNSAYSTEPCEIYLPLLVGSVDTVGYAEGVAVSGSYAYVAADFSGLQVVDISDSDTPVIVAAVDTPSYGAQDVAISGSLACVADFDLGLQVVDISNPLEPAIVSSADLQMSAFGVAVSGSYAYVTGLRESVQTVDISNSSAYVTESYLQIVDIANPTDPVIVGSLYIPDIVHDVAVSGGYAYVAAGSAGLQIVDISDPSEPVIVGSADTPDQAFGVAVSGGYAYVADYLSGLQVVDLSKPFKPQIVGSVGLPGPADKLAVSDFYAYVGDSGAGLQVVDISNPSAPRIVATVNTPGLAGDVKVSGSYAYVADFDSGLQVINLCPSISVLQADRFTSISEDDGWVLESTETSNVGGLFGATAAHALALRIGDDYGGVAQGERQFKSIVSFDTSRLPDDATVVSAVLCLTIGDVVGRNPVETHKPCYLDIKTGTFGTQALEASDFQAEATATQVAIMSASSAGRRVSVGISDASGLEAINKVGLTQMRVYFSRDDNDDDNDDFIGVYSGETSAGNTPVLKVWFLEPVHPNLDE